jgi:hypothetical protein
MKSRPKKKLNHWISSCGSQQKATLDYVYHLKKTKSSKSLQRLISLDRVNRRDRFSMKKPLLSSARGASFHTKHASNVNAIETY